MCQILNCYFYALIHLKKKYFKWIATSSTKQTRLYTGVLIRNRLMLHLYSTCQLSQFCNVEIICNLNPRKQSLTWSWSDSPLRQHVILNITEQTHFFLFNFLFTYIGFFKWISITGNLQLPHQIYLQIHLIRFILALRKLRSHKCKP